MERQGRIAELISLLDYAISTGNDDLAQEIRSDIFKETKGTLQMNHGGIANIEDMIAPIGMAGGGDYKDQLELEIIKLESTIQSLRADEVLTGTDNSKAIRGNQNLLEYYRSLR
tara:strand:- start:184 stop:525 length:342 start_codon:yes stop_codon:yes gene_type:complete